jgi:hypothetical protein
MDGRVEAVIFASPKPVSRELLARAVGPECNLDLLIDDIRAELTGRPYELVAVAGGFQQRTRKRFAETIRAAVGLGDGARSLSCSRTMRRCRRQDSHSPQREERSGGMLEMIERYLPQDAAASCSIGSQGARPRLDVRWRWDAISRSMLRWIGAAPPSPDCRSIGS